ncbi:MAG: hypothetical protein U0354_10675 [Candidatus Sericytochromatia bacterium]
MKKNILFILSIVILGCSTPNNKIVNVLQEESKLNINSNDYKGNFIIFDKINPLYKEDLFKNFYLAKNHIYVKPSLSINENGKGFINAYSKTALISKNIPTKIMFNLNISTYALYLKIDNNGDGIAISRRVRNTPTGISPAPVSITTFIRYQPTDIYIKNNEYYDEDYVDVSLIDYVPERDPYKNFNYLSDFKLDKKGNGLVIYPDYLTLNNSDIPNRYKSIEIKNFKPLKDTIKKIDSFDFIQVVRKKDNNLSVVGIPIKTKLLQNLTNKPNIDENGNGTITYTDTGFNLYVQKIIDYKLIGEPIQLLTTKRNSIDCKINSDGDGLIVYTDSEIENEDYTFGKLYFSEVKNFKIQEKQLISNSENCINGTLDFNSKGNGLIVWQNGDKIYGRRLENYKMQ